MIRLTTQSIHDYQEGVYPVLARNMLRNYGFRPARDEGGGERLWAHKDDPSLNVAITNNANVSYEKLQEIGRLCEAAEQIVPKKPEALPQWVHLEEGYDAEKIGNDISVWHKDYPEFRMELSPKQGERTDNIFAAKYDVFQQSLEAYKQRLKSLEAEHGFVYERHQDELIIKQPDYGFMLVCNGSDSDIFLELDEIEAQAEKACLERWEKLDALKDKGVTFTRYPAAENGDIMLELSHPKWDAPRTITLHGNLDRIDASGLDTINELSAMLPNDATAAKSATTATPEAVAKPEPTKSEPVIATNGQVKLDKVVATPEIAAPKPAIAVIGAIEPKPVAVKPVSRTMADYVPKPKAELPENQKTALIMDASALKELAVQRGHGRTWLDALPIIANSSAVEKIYIPSTIADWELRGGVTYSEDGQTPKFRQINPKFTDPSTRQGREYPAIDELLSTASRWHIDKHGKGHLIAGKNPNIVICETDFDRKFMDRVLQIHNQPNVSEARKKLESQSLIRGLNGHIGERAMERVAHALPEKCPAFFVCNDIDYLRNRDKISTLYGYPVGEATVIGLMHSAIKSNGADLKQQLESTYGFPAGEVTTNRIKDDVMRSGRHSIRGNYPAGHPICTPGHYNTSTGKHEGEPLITIFERGAAAERGEHISFHMPEPSSNQPAKSPIVQPVHKPYVVKELIKEAVPPTPKPVVATLETAKAEAAKVEAAKVEAAKVEAAKVEAAKVEAAKVEAAKVEAAKGKPIPSQVIVPGKNPQPKASADDDVPKVVGSPIGFEINALPPTESLVATINLPVSIRGTSPAEKLPLRPTPKPVATVKAKPLEGPTKAKLPEKPIVLAKPIQAIIEKKSMDIPFEQTLGYKIGYHRIQRDMTEKQLADAIKQTASYKPSVDEDTVFKWQTGQELPQAELYETLKQVLIDDNAQVTDKEAAKKELDTAYSNACKSNPDAAEKFAFVNAMRSLRKKAGLMDDGLLAEKISERAKPTIEESPESIDPMLVYKISTGGQRPSLGFLQAMIKAMDQVQPLADEEKKELYDLHAKGVSASEKLLAGKSEEPRTR